jgi:hypothetical protein
MKHEILTLTAGCLLALLPAGRAQQNNGSAPPGSGGIDITQQITDLQNKVKLLEAQQALNQSAVTLKTDAATAQTNLVTAQNNLLSAQIASLKQLLPSLQSGVQGAISGDGGTIRATVDAWQNLGPSVSVLAKDLKTKLGATCKVVVNPAAMDDYVTSKWLAESLGAVAEALPKKTESLRSLTPPELLPAAEVPAPPPPPQGVGPSGIGLAIPALSGSLIDTIVGISKLFRTDRDITGVTINAPSNDALFDLWASKLTEQECEVSDIDHLLVPDQNYLATLKSSLFYKNLQEVLNKLSDLDKVYRTVAGNVMTREGDPAKPNPIYDAALARWKDSSDAVHQAIDPIATIPIASADAFGLKILKGVLLTDFFEAKKGHVLYARVEAIGGTRVTTKKTFTSDKEYEASGYVLTYKVLNGTGEVEAAKIVPFNQPFEKMQLP